MSSSREDSPDWLRSYQVPTHSTLNLSSNSDSSDKDSLSEGYRFGSQALGRGGSDNEDDVVLVEHGDELPREEVPEAEDDKRSKKRKKKKTEGNGCDGPVVEEQILDRLVGTRAAKHSIWTLSSDSESGPDNVISLARERKEHEVLESRKDDNKDEALVGIKQKSPSKKVSTEKSSKMRTKETNDVMEVLEDTSEKHASSHVSSSRLPLVLSEKVNCSKALVECEGESIDLSGDVGAVGRTVISDTPSGNREMYFDLKGTIYRTSIIPSRTFCVVSFGQSEAKIEAIMNDFIQLEPQSNVYEAETMVEGTLEGFSFDSEDEADKTAKASHQNDQDEGNDENVDGKSKGKAQKSSGVAQKRGKTGGGKSLPAKKARKKTQASKKTKAKK